MNLNALELSQALIRRPSITPEDFGALGVLEDFLNVNGFACQRLPFYEEGTPTVDNLYARIGKCAPNFCFAGHTDVVPPGDITEWASDPFTPEIRDGVLYGRGAADMKCAIAAFTIAACRFVKMRGIQKLPGSLSLLITGDEEGPAINGTIKVLKWMQEKGESIDACLVGEPTNPKNLGEMIKIGRRGSLNAIVKVTGSQGHVAYPDIADNPVPRLLTFLKAAGDHIFDTGNENFPPTNLEITSVDVGNPTTNLIPGHAEARLNIRFNDEHTGAELSTFLEMLCKKLAGDRSHIDISISGESFLTPPGRLSTIVSEAVAHVTGVHPKLSTTGGTSDARFIQKYCPVIEFGLINETAHKIDENARVADILALTDIYEETLIRYFDAP
ncbi:MAG: succinyl-diaminopimelate desuccinylase [Magnetovibrio sp.]|nr:succinyl-diaminopimelate desuccinylase [Magnetovibrio sp.]|tara:strand:+ start:807 stop:1964 length:1158 start_codon:yes stop_codon:yes gene_type:complete